jgi:glycine/D-amino acid oxidase-like deaminating enzyme
VKVAVVGGGIFGGVIAWRLAESGIEVELFEKETSLVSGSTSKSVLRLHLGLHYPRDLDTAIQSRIGYQSFLKEFGSSVDLGFDNYYAVARENSKVSTSEFVEFAQKAKIEIKPHNPRDLESYGFAFEKVESVFSAPEGVIDSAKLRIELRQRLIAENAEIRLGVEISRAEYKSGRWKLLTESEGSFGPFDAVVRATYASDQIQVAGTSYKSSILEFQNTLVLRASVGLGGVGMTIIDGDFLTVLPEAFNSKHLLYGPKPSVLRRLVADSMPPEFYTHAPSRKNIQVDGVVNRFRSWFPFSPPIIDIERLDGFRCIEAGVEASDRRVTSIQSVAPNMFMVLSGKIDHCFIAAEEVIRKIKFTQP